MIVAYSCSPSILYLSALSKWLISIQRNTHNQMCASSYSKRFAINAMNYCSFFSPFICLTSILPFICLTSVPPFICEADEQLPVIAGFCVSLLASSFFHFWFFFCCFFPSHSPHLSPKCYMSNLITNKIVINNITK